MPRAKRAAATKVVAFDEPIEKEEKDEPQQQTDPGEPPAVNIMRIDQEPLAAVAGQPEVAPDSSNHGSDSHDNNENPEHEESDGIEHAAPACERCESTNILLRRLVERTANAENSNFDLEMRNKVLGEQYGVCKERSDVKGTMLFHQGVGLVLVGAISIIFSYI